MKPSIWSLTAALTVLAGACTCVGVLPPCAAADDGCELEKPALDSGQVDPPDAGEQPPDAGEQPTDAGHAIDSGQVMPVDAGHADVTPPETTLSNGSSGTQSVDSAIFTFSGVDDVTPVAGLSYAHQLAPLEAAYSAFSTATTAQYTNLANGAYTFYVKAKDAAGNEDATPATYMMTVAVPMGPQVVVGNATVPSNSTVTVYWSGIPSATGADWIGLFVPGEPSTPSIRWMYTSCDQSGGAVKSSGFCPFVLDVSPGTYEFRLFPDDTHAELAISSTLTVTP